MQNVLHLFTAYQKVAEIVRNKPAAVGGKRRTAGGNANGKLATKSLLSLGLVSEALAALFR